MLLVNRTGREVEVPDEDLTLINEYQSQGYGTPEAVQAAIAADDAYDAEQVRRGDEEATRLDAARQQQEQAAYDAEQATLGYRADRWTADALRDEIRTRNSTRPDDQHLPVSGKKEELVSVLEADDANPPAPAGPDQPDGTSGSEDTAT